MIVFSHKLREMIKVRTRCIYKPFIWRYPERKETCSTIVEIGLLVTASFWILSTSENPDDSIANCIPIHCRLISFWLLVKVSLVTIQFIRFMDPEQSNCKPSVRLIELSLPLQEASLRLRRTCKIVSDIIRTQWEKIPNPKPKLPAEQNPISSTGI